MQGADAQNVLMRPPALSMIDAGVPLPSYPDRSTSFTPNDPAFPAGPGTYRVGYSADRQPYNATSFGVYCTGSGTKSLPYRDAIAPFVPEFVSPSLHAVLPGTGAADNLVRPFGVVDQTRLGTTRAQYVSQAETDGAGDVVAGPACWYEVGLDWKVPPITIQARNAPTGASTNWPSTQIANVRDAIMKTLWIQATPGDDSTTEPHPEWSNSVPFTDLALQAATQLNPAFNTNPAPGTGWEAPYGLPLTYGGDPGFLSALSGVIEPDVAPTAAGADVVVAGAVYAPRADLVLKCYRVEQVITEADSAGNPGLDSVFTTVMHVAPVIRIWVLQQTAAADWEPAPLGRGFTRPCSSDSALQPPCINVQVWQKNSSATDGTDTPVFDLLGDWQSLGESGA